MSSTADAAVDAVEAPRDELREGLVEALRTELGDALVATSLRPNDELWVRVATGAWREAADAAHFALGLDYFCFLSAIDWLPSPYGRGEDDPTQPPPERSSTIEQGETGGDTRFQLLARLSSTRTSVGVLLKADVPDGDLRMPTWTPVYAGADWHERETWEMFGIHFEGHPNLRHIYLPSDFEGHPLRKDYPLIARMVKPWPGIVDVEPMPAGLGDDESEGGESE